MASRPGKGPESHATSSSLIPQILQSRRGSVTSITDHAQIDKETLSQTLDQIHSAACQTRALTTFNEYTTPPPASSHAADTKGIASELHGGISGLYNRLKASVGSVKETGHEDAGGDVGGREPVKIPFLPKSSPVPTLAEPEEEFGLASVSATGDAGNAKAEVDSQSLPLPKSAPESIEELRQDKKPFRPTIGSAAPSSRSTWTLTRNVPPARSEVVVVSALTSADTAVGNPPVAHQGSTEWSRLPSDGTGKHPIPARSVAERSWLPNEVSAKTLSQQGSSLERNTHSMTTDQMPASVEESDSVGRSPAATILGDFNDKPEQPTIIDTARIESSSNRSRTEIGRLGATSTIHDDKKIMPKAANEDHARKGVVPRKDVSEPSNNGISPSDQERSRPNVSSQGKRGKPQHLELPPRKSLAPPLVSKQDHPSGLPMSRTSSNDTNTDSILSNSRSVLPSAYISGSQVGISPPRPTKPVPQNLLNRDPQVVHVFSQARNKVLNKEYWMKDENARDCFNCGDPFTTFRRKHHCRICGQIFDAKCTSTVAGERFGHPGSLRVCLICEGFITANDDSSEFSDDESIKFPAFRPRHGSTGASDIFSSSAADSSPPFAGRSRKSTNHTELAAPTMSIPAARKAGEKARKSTVLEIGGMHNLTRPSSSRSLKSAFGNKPFTPGHRRHNSRHQGPRAFKPLPEDDAPFHQEARETKLNATRLHAFHDDNIIDPDLAPYLSDDASSGDEQINIMAALNGDSLLRSHDNDRNGLSGFQPPSRRGRGKLGEKSLSAVTFASRDTDTHSLHSAKLANTSRGAKRRNMSFSGSSHMRPSLRSRANLSTPLFGIGTIDNSSTLGLAQTSTPLNTTTSRIMRSSSLKGDDAPAMELNPASLEHVRKLLNQLLRDSKITNVSSWEKALIPILLKATDEVNPDVAGGDDIDIRHYVKLKKISGGRPGDTSYVSGLVFTKNLALKSMPRNISHPNILILTFPLEYARHQQHFMSLEPVIRQEREFLQNLVNRIAALRPHLLLVERRVSGLALEFLEQAGIATAQNVKTSVLEAVSRCCQTRIISSIDKLAIKPAQAGKCASFHVKTYIHQGRKKTYMFLSGCAKELGCTVVLRGDSDDVLSKIKLITEFMIYVVYNLKLETSLMRDEFAAIPSTFEGGSLSNSTDTRSYSIASRNIHEPGTRSPPLDAASLNQSLRQRESPTEIENAQLDKPVEKVQPEAPHEEQKMSLPQEDSVPDDVPMPTFYSDMVEENKTKILSASPFVKFTQPYLLMRAREQERRLAYLKRLRDQDLLEEQKGEEKPKVEKFDLIKPEMVHEVVANAPRKVREVLRAVHEAQYDKALHTYQTQTKQWETYIAGSLDLFDPCARQNIAVLYSVVCTTTTVPCAGPDMLALEFYNEHEEDADFEADCTLGQYVEDLCLGSNTVCTSNGCEKKMMEHHRQYVHGEGQVSVFVERYPCKISGLQDTILMWSLCRICSAETQVFGMSENTWKYSFGKYLELSFWSHDLRAGAQTCVHDLHQDHLRYFGFKDMALRVQYDPITLLEIIVPRPRITWKVENDLRFKNDLFGKIEERLNKFMYSVKARIKSINTQSVLPEKMDACKEEIERLSKKAADDHHSLVQKLRKRYMNSKHFEVIPLNRALRATQEKVAEWDNAFADFDRNYFPSEKDIRRLATLQLKSIFLERDQSVKTASTSEDGSTASISQDPINEKTSTKDVPALSPQTRDMSHETAQDMLASVIGRHASTKDQDTTSLDALVEKSEAPDLVEKEGIRHLDLAIPASITKADESKAVESIHTDASIGQSKGFEEQPRTETVVPPIANAVDDQKPAINAKSPVVKPSDVPDRGQASAIPRPIDLKTRQTRSRLSPPATRPQSQPGHTRSNESSIDSTNADPPALHSPTLHSPTLHSPTSNVKTAKASPATSINTSANTKSVDKKFSDRLSLAGAVAQSMIPRSITRKKDSKVSNLAKHFEQLSREFERERLKERRQRAAKSRRSRAFPMAASKPIVQVYRNFHEAVEEKEPSVEDLISSDPSQQSQEESMKTSQAVAENQISETPGDGFHAEGTVADETEAEDQVAETDAEVERESDEDYTIFDDLEIPGVAEEHHALTPEEAQLDLKLDLPKHEKTSLMKMLTNFWAERSASGWQPLEYPLNATDHIFADSDIIVREDEPSSLVALALSSEDYEAKLTIISNNTRASASKESIGLSSQNSPESDEQFSVENSLLCPTGTHLKYQFSESSAKMLCKVFYAEQFDALRRKCGVADRFVESLSRCMKWDSKGGKTKSVFLKTLDDRFVLKSLSPIETQAFLRFAPAYFRIIAESLFHEMPSVIAKMLGFYQVIIKNPVTGVEFNWFLLVMENLFYDRSPTRIFDLKGSMRNRRIESTGEQNEVLLDENMVEFIYESPLFTREHSKKLLRASVWNDTLFLSRQNVMDYSLMIAIDEDRNELVVGIIDCIRTYTWDKKLESWIKDRGKNRPTVTSPKEYKSRFREAMSRYVLQAPSCWHQFKVQQFETRPIRPEDPGDDKETHVVGL